MICLGVDPGQSRVGLALGQGSLAIALQTIPIDGAVETICAMANEKGAERIYVGLPLSLSGTTTDSTLNALAFATLLARLATVPIFVIDERLTTSESLRLAQLAGKSTKQSREFIDAEAARLIVESAISSNHTSGTELEDYLARDK